MSTGSKRAGDDGGERRKEDARIGGSVDPERTRDRLESMRGTLRTERRRLVDERQAFGAFRKRLSEIDPGQPPTGRSAGSRVVGTAPARSVSPGLVAVRDAYEETVMSVPHYAEDYDDTYPESLEAEFGAEMAAALTRGSALDPSLKRELSGAAGRLRENRDAFVGTLDTEASSLSARSDRLLELDAELEGIANAEFGDMDFGALDAHRARIEVLRDRCEEDVRERQETIHEQRRELRVPGDSPDVPRYLYREQSARYPILSMLADRIDRLDALRSTVETAMARR